MLSGRLCCWDLCALQPLTRTIWCLLSPHSFLAHSPYIKCSPSCIGWEDFALSAVAGALKGLLTCNGWVFVIRLEVSECCFYVSLHFCTVCVQSAKALNLHLHLHLHLWVFVGAMYVWPLCNKAPACLYPVSVCKTDMGGMLLGAPEACKGTAFPSSLKPVDWWGRCCSCSLIHHTLYLGFRGKEKRKKGKIKEKRLPKISELGVGVVCSRTEEGEAPCPALLPTLARLSLSRCWKRSLTLVTPCHSTTPALLTKDR